MGLQQIYLSNIFNIKGPSNYRIKILSKRHIANTYDSRLLWWKLFSLPSIFNYRVAILWNEFFILITCNCTTRLTVLETVVKRLLLVVQRLPLDDCLKQENLACITHVRTVYVRTVCHTTTIIDTKSNALIAILSLEQHCHCSLAVG